MKNLKHQDQRPDADRITSGLLRDTIPLLVIAFAGAGVRADSFSWIGGNGKWDGGPGTSNWLNTTTAPPTRVQVPPNDWSADIMIGTADTIEMSIGDLALKSLNVTAAATLRPRPNSGVWISCWNDLTLNGACTVGTSIARVPIYLRSRFGSITIGTGSTVRLDGAAHNDENPQGITILAGRAVDVRGKIDATPRTLGWVSLTGNINIAAGARILAGPGVWGVGAARPGKGASVMLNGVVTNAGEVQAGDGGVGAEVNSAAGGDIEINAIECVNTGMIMAGLGGLHNSPLFARNGGPGGNITINCPPPSLGVTNDGAGIIAGGDGGESGRATGGAGGSVTIRSTTLTTAAESTIRAGGGGTGRKGGKGGKLDIQTSRAEGVVHRGKARGGRGGESDRGIRGGDGGDLEVKATDGTLTAGPKAQFHGGAPGRDVLMDFGLRGNVDIFATRGAEFARDPGATNVVILSNTYKVRVGPGARLGLDGLHRNAIMGESVAEAAISVIEAGCPGGVIDLRGIGQNTRVFNLDNVGILRIRGEVLLGRSVELESLVNGLVQPAGCSACYADCDESTGTGILDIFDFLCFQNRFAAGDPYACDCDRSSGAGRCDIFDFLCFQNAYAAGCP